MLDPKKAAELVLTLYRINKLVDFKERRGFSKEKLTNDLSRLLDELGASSSTSGDTLPSNPSVGDFFWYEPDEVLYKYVEDGGSFIWLDISSAAQVGQGDGLVRTVVNNPASPYTPNNGDIIIWDTTSGNKVLSLPAAASSSNFAFNVKKIDNTANTITVDPDGAELIEEGATAVITTQYEALSAVCDGTEWWVIAAI